MKWVMIVLLIFLIGLVGYLSYFVFVNFYSSPDRIELGYAGNPHINFSDSQTKQFYPNMRFKTGRISYYFGNECPKEKTNNMVQAFRYLENRTGGKLEFYEKNPGDISVRCGKEFEAGGGLYVAGEGGPILIINGSLFNVIIEGQILLLYSESCSYNIEVHELLHVLGFDHSPDSRSIMYNVSNCNQVLAEDIVNEIIRLYSYESLPDLTFGEISASKKGMYLSMNFSVRNQGLADAENVKVALLADDSNREEFDFDDIELGSRRLFYFENLRIPISTKNITLVIEDGAEIYSENNIAVLNVKN